MSKKTPSKFKASIVGCGSVGSTTAYAYLLSGAVNEMTLIDLNKGKAEGLMLDLLHATSFTPHTEISAADDFAECNIGYSLNVFRVG